MYQKAKREGKEGSVPKGAHEADCAIFGEGIVVAEGLRGGEFGGWNGYCW